MRRPVRVPWVIRGLLISTVLVAVAVGAAILLRSNAGPAAAAGETIFTGGFIGTYQNQEVRLPLSGLPPHTELTVSFELRLRYTWDGNGDSCCGPDIWQLRVEDGPTLIRTTFANRTTNLQAYPDSYPGGAHPGFTGATKVHLGFNPAWTTVSDYDLTFTFPHTGDSVELVFSAENLQTYCTCDENWDLPSVEVGVPTPADDILGAYRAAIDGNPVEWLQNVAGPLSGALYNASSFFQPRGYACVEYQGKVLVWLNGLRATNPESLKGWDYGPIQVLGPPGGALRGLHQAVVIYPSGTDWRQTGTVLDPWLTQTPEDYAIQEWPSKKLWLRPIIELGLAHSAFYPDDYPTSGNPYPNTEYAPATMFDKQVIVRGPVNVVVENAAGDRVGLLADGTFVQELPAGGEGYIGEAADGAQLVYLGVPNDGPFSLSLTAFANGSVTVTIASTQPDGSQQVASYADFQVSSGNTASADLTADDALLVVDGSPMTPEMSNSDPLAPDADGDALPDIAEHYFHATNPLVLDTDLDGCSDGAEVQPSPGSELIGGLRDPLNEWDFYDVGNVDGYASTTGAKDGVVDLFNDIVLTIQAFNNYNVSADRGPSTGPNPWNMTAPDGVVDLFNDIVGVISQFGHDCR